MWWRERTRKSHKAGKIRSLLPSAYLPLLRIDIRIVPSGDCFILEMLQSKSNSSRQWEGESQVKMKVFTIMALIVTVMCITGDNLINFLFLLEKVTSHLYNWTLLSAQEGLLIQISCYGKMIFIVCFPVASNNPIFRVFPLTRNYYCHQGWIFFYLLWGTEETLCIYCSWNFPTASHCSYDKRQTRFLSTMSKALDDWALILSAASTFMIFPPATLAISTSCKVSPPLLPWSLHL